MNGVVKWQNGGKFRAQLGHRASDLDSEQWEYFGFWSVDGKNAECRDKVVCKLCKLELAYHSTTSNLRSHLETVHPTEHGLSGTPTKQPRLDSYFSPPATSSLSAPRQEACTKKLAAFICKDMRPISIVDGTSFREFCKEMEPSKSTTDSYLLQQKQQLLGLKKEKLINDCPTCWNSTYEMICRASEQQAAVSAVIFEKKLSRMELTTSEWPLMEKVQGVLKPFKVATEALSGDKYPTASAVLPLQHVLCSQLKKKTGDEPEPPALTEMKTKIITDLEKQYSSEKDAFMLLNKASYPDPCFHRLVHLKEEQKQEVKVAILEATDGRRHR
ncbi:hypothetical protein ABVT39_011914 [Epinephelus coioides]